MMLSAAVAIVVGSMPVIDITQKNLRLPIFLLGKLGAGLSCDRLSLRMWEVL